MNIPVKTSLEFFAPKPTITLVESADRVKFVESVLEKAREAALDSSDVEINILCLCHFSLVDAMKGSLTQAEQNKIIFSIPEDILGCQFAVVILAIDFSTIAPTFQYVTDMLTRATTVIKCVVNKTLAPLMINNLPTFTTTRCNLADIPCFFQTLLSQCGNDGRIYVTDIDALIPKPIRAMLNISRINFDWWLRREGETEVEKRQKTRFASVVVTVAAPTITNSECQSSYAPVIELVVMGEGDSDCSRDYDDVYRRPINRFFAKYALQTEDT